MFSQPYQLEEIGFACCFRVYYRWRTHRARPCPALAALDRETLGSLLHPYGIWEGGARPAVATSVSIRRASRRHSGGRGEAGGSDERKHPPGKPAAFGREGRGPR